MPVSTESLSSTAVPAVPRPAGNRRLWIPVAVVVWILGVTVGFAALDRHAATPGESSPAPSQWPSTSRLSRAPAPRWTLLLFAHPKCPCTRATVAELEVLMAGSKSRVDAKVVFVRPAGVPTDWERTDLWDRASEIPGVVTGVDESGVEATRFGALTSGQVLLYDAAGALRFSGGITASRGHSGDNAGRTAIEDLLAGRSDTLARTPVFGCQLLGPACGTKDATCLR